MTRITTLFAALALTAALAACSTAANHDPVQTDQNPAHHMHYSDK